MSAAPLYRKTTKGGEAISARLHGVVGRLRSLLILVDGKRTQAELVALGSALGDVGQMLGQLEADGLIENLLRAVPGQAAAVAATSAATAVGPNAPPPVARQPGSTLASVKAFAARRLMETLGPTSASLCIKIESAQTVGEFVEAVKRAYAIVKDVRGAAEAERFGAEVEANMPAV